MGFGDGNEGFLDVRGVVVEDMEQEGFGVACGGERVLGKGDGGEGVEDNGRKRGGDSGDVLGSGVCVVGCYGDEDVNG